MLILLKPTKYYSSPWMLRETSEYLHFCTCIYFCVWWWVSTYVHVLCHNQHLHNCLQVVQFLFAWLSEGIFVCQNLHKYAHVRMRKRNGKDRFVAVFGYTICMLCFIVSTFNIPGCIPLNMRMCIYVCMCVCVTEVCVCVWLCLSGGSVVMHSACGQQAFGFKS